MSDTDNPYGGGSAGYSAGVNYGSAPAPAPSAAPAAAPQGAAVKDIGTAEFMAEVIEASKDRPVIVDFWAPWCGPCKTLGPVIEKVVIEAKGAVTLAKMDIEKHPEVAGQMGIQSIPAVVAFIDGRPADAFMGAKGEAEVRDFVKKVMEKKPTAEAQGMAEVQAEADALFAGQDFAGAAERYSAVLAQEPANLDALAGLGQCYVAVGEPDMAQQLIASVPPEHLEKGAMAALVKTLELQAQAEDLGDLEPLAAAVEANPKDHQARADYAVALNAAGKREEAAEQLLAIIRTDRKWEDDGARTRLLEFFESWGNMDPATISGRRALSSILFS